MSLDLKKWEGNLKSSWNKFLKENILDSWILYNFEGNTFQLQHAGSGDDGVEGLLDDLSEGRLAFAALIVKDQNSGLNKVVFILWQGESTPRQIKAKASTFTSEIKNFFQGYHLDIVARNPDDLDVEFINEKVNSASRSNYCPDSCQQESNHAFKSKEYIYKDTNLQPDAKQTVNSKFTSSRTFFKTSSNSCGIKSGQALFKNSNDQTDQILSDSKIDLAVPTISIKTNAETEKGSKKTYVKKDINMRTNIPSHGKQQYSKSYETNTKNINKSFKDSSNVELSRSSRLDSTISTTTNTLHQKQVLSQQHLPQTQSMKKHSSSNISSNMGRDSLKRPQNESKLRCSNENNPSELEKISLTITKGSVSKRREIFSNLNDSNVQTPSFNKIDAQSEINKCKKLGKTMDTTSGDMCSKTSTTIPVNSQQHIKSQEKISLHQDNLAPKNSPQFTDTESNSEKNESWNCSNKSKSYISNSLNQVQQNPKISYAKNETTQTECNISNQGSTIQSINEYKTNDLFKILPRKELNQVKDCNIPINNLDADLQKMTSIKEKIQHISQLTTESTPKLHQIKTQSDESVKSPTSNFQVVALFDYQADEVGELTFKEGEYLTVVEEDGEWWLAINSNGLKGQIPCNFVEKADKPSHLDSTSIIPREISNNQTAPTEIPNQPSTETVVQPVNKETIAVAEFDYFGEDDTELSFKEGDKLTITNTDSEWWSAIDKDGNVGIIPYNFVVLDKQNCKETTSVESESKPDDDQKMKVMFDYEKEEDGELTIKEGETLYVVSKEDKGWWLVRNNRGEVGLVPVNYLASTEAVIVL